jgi:hypothetical protein
MNKERSQEVRKASPREKRADGSEWSLGPESIARSFQCGGYQMDHGPLLVVGARAPRLKAPRGEVRVHGVRLLCGHQHDILKAI